jgi:hypothetical protein
MDVAAYCVVVGGNADQCGVVGMRAMSVTSFFWIITGLQLSDSAQLGMFAVQKIADTFNRRHQVLV